MRPPKLIKPYVNSFCRSIVADPQPVYVPVRPKFGAPQDECFSIVRAHIAEHGGEQVIGWAIWEWPRVLIEGEFHCILRQPDSTLLDITPKAAPIPRILFLPEPRRTYHGQQVDNIRKPLGHDPTIKRFCELCTLMHREQNLGDMSKYHGPIVYTERMRRIEDERQKLGVLLHHRYGATSPEAFTE